VFWLGFGIGVVVGFILLLGILGSIMKIMD